MVHFVIFFIIAAIILAASKLLIKFMLDLFSKNFRFEKKTKVEFELTCIFVGWVGVESFQYFRDMYQWGYLGATLLTVVIVVGFFFALVSMSKNNDSPKAIFSFINGGQLFISEESWNGRPYLGLVDAHENVILPRDFVSITKGAGAGVNVLTCTTLSGINLNFFPNKMSVDDFKSMNESYLMISTQNKWGVSSPMGEIIVPISFDSIFVKYSREKYHIFEVSNDSLKFFFDSHRNFFDRYLELGDFVAFRKDSLWGLMNETGHILLENKFQGITKLESSHFKTFLNGKAGLFSSNGKQILPNNYFDVVSVLIDKAIVKKDLSQYCVVDFNGVELASYAYPIFFGAWKEVFTLDSFQYRKAGSELVKDPLLLKTNWKNLCKISSQEDMSSSRIQPQFNEALKNFIGQKKAKEKLEELAAIVFKNEMYKKLGEKQSSVNFNCVFLGNPGTGKTTFAEIMAKEIKRLGLLKKGHFISVQASDLIAGYLGQTANKTKEVFQSALGGILFVDEAYALQHGDNSYGKECISSLVDLMERHRGEIIVILAGYEKEMNDLLSVNPGLEQRIPHKVYFDDYSADELKQILKNMFDREKYQVKDELLNIALEQILQEKRGKNFANARNVKNVFERVMTQQSIRLKNEFQGKEISIEDLKRLVYSDFTPEKETQPVLEAPKTNGHVKQDYFSDMIGLKSVKDELHKLTMVLQMLKIKKISIDDAKIGLNFLFVGNPGTGKTTVAVRLGKILKEQGFLSHGTVSNLSKQDLVAGFAGQTLTKTKEALERSLGGVFFLDEAYSLVKSDQDQYGFEAMETILKFIEDNKGKMAVVFAGYPSEMDQLLERNSGLRSRFDHNFRFEDLNIDDMQLLTLKELSKLKLKLSSEAQEYLPNFLQKLKATPGFANARTVIRTVNQMLVTQSVRLVPAGEINGEEETVITLEDLLVMEEQRNKT